MEDVASELGVTSGDTEANSEELAGLDRKVESSVSGSCLLKPDVDGCDCLDLLFTLALPKQSS